MPTRKGYFLLTDEGVTSCWSGFLIDDARFEDVLREEGFFNAEGLADIFDIFLEADGFSAIQCLKTLE